MKKPTKAYIRKQAAHSYQCADVASLCQWLIWEGWESVEAKAPAEHVRLSQGEGVLIVVFSSGQVTTQGEAADRALIALVQVEERLGRDERDSLERAYSRILNFKPSHPQA